jgi:hypothetical protein
MSINDETVPENRCRGGAVFPQRRIKRTPRCDRKGYATLSGYMFENALTAVDEHEHEYYTFAWSHTNACGRFADHDDAGGRWNYDLGKP